VRWTFVGVLGVAAVLGIAAGFEYDAASDVTVYRSAWSLRDIADDGTSIRIAVAEGCGGEDRFDHAEFRELDAALEVTVFNRVPTHGDCTDEGRVGRYDLRLPRPLGDDRIVAGCWEGSNAPGCYRFQER